MATTVGAALNHEMAVLDNICLLSDVSMHRTTATAIKCASLLLGPPLFAYSNLLAATPIRLHTHDHSRLQLAIGTASSFTPVAVHACGADFYSYLQEGEKLWYLAPPERADEFIAMYLGSVSPVVVNIESPHQYREHRRFNVCTVHQSAGDTVYVPGGWAYTSQSISTTVSFGSSFLHAWKLGETTKFAARSGQVITETATNIRGMYKCIASEPNKWGLSEDEAREILAQWENTIAYWSNKESI